MERQNRPNWPTSGLAQREQGARHAHIAVFGCRNSDGTFCAEKFAETAQHEQVKMVERSVVQP